MRLFKPIPFAVSLAFMALMARADQLPIAKFSGLNTDHSPATLTDGQTPDSENVVTDEGPGLSPRQGFTACGSVGAVHQWNFPHSNGTRYLIIESTSSTLLADTGDCSFSITISTVPGGAVRTAGAALGDKFFWMNQTDGLQYWDTTSVTVASATLQGNQLVAHKNRLWAGGLSADPRAVRASKFDDGTDWTIVIDPTVLDPAVFIIGGAVDEPLTALYASHQDALVWMKPRSFGVISGNSRADFTVRTYSDDVGTAYSDSIRDCDGLLRWLGPARTVYEWNGSALKNIGDNIDGQLSLLSQGDANARSYTITSAADYATGTAFHGSTSTYPGSFTIAYNEGNPIDNSFESGSGWQYFGSDASIVTSGCGTPPGGSKYLRILKTASLSYWVGSGGYSFTGAGTCPSFNQISVSNPSSGLLPIGTLTTWGFTGLGNSYAFAKTNRIGTGDITVYFAEDSTYWYLDLVEGGWVDYTSATWSSAHFDTSNISTSDGWGIFAADTDLNAGSATYALYTDSNTSVSFSNGVPVAGTWVSSATLTSGMDVTIATAPYSFLTTRLSVASSTMTFPVNNSLTLGWTEGVALQTPSAWFRGRYWLGMAQNSTANNRVLVYDRNHQWQLYNGISAASLGVYSGSLFFGNSDGFFQYETGYSDNGTDISAYYTTPTFSPAGPNLSNAFNELQVTTDNGDATLSTTYQVNGVSTNYDLADMVMNASAGIQNRRLMFPFSQVQQGRNISFKFSVSSSASWRLLGASLDYRPDLVPE